LHRIQYAVKQGWVRLCNALKCISEAIVTIKENNVADREAAVTIMTVRASASTMHVELILEVVSVIIPI